MVAEETGVNAAGLDDKDAAAKRNSFAGASFLCSFYFPVYRYFIYSIAISIRGEFLITPR